MELRALVFLVCLPAFITGTLSKQTKQDFKTTLRDNMKKYFKSYTLGNFRDINEKQLSALKIKKWVGEHVSRRARMTQMVFMADETEEYMYSPLIKAASQENKVISNNGTRIEALLDDKVLESSFGKRDNSNEENTDSLAWFHKAADLRQKITSDFDSFFKSWSDVLNALPNGCDESPKLPMSAHHADISLLGVTPVFMNLFWPFRFDMNVMNQRLAAYGLTKKIISENRETLKLDFFEELEHLQGIRLPVKGNQIMLSFGDEGVVEGLNRSTLASHSKVYAKAGKHLYTKDEQTRIRLLANKALDLINKTHAELYNTMVQMISCIAFFKDEAASHVGGSSNSALGLVWLDPRKDWTVPVIAEQIVHEFIHTSLFYAELVHGGFKDVSQVTEVKAMSSLRHEPRPYDKSLHAAYVSAGLITFHTRAGFVDRAAKLAEALPGAVRELNRVNSETDVLDEAGQAMLNFLTDYVCLTRM